MAGGGQQHPAKALQCGGQVVLLGRLPALPGTGAGKVGKVLQALLLSVIGGAAAANGAPGCPVQISHLVTQLGQRLCTLQRIGHPAVKPRGAARALLQHIELIERLAQGDHGDVGVGNLLLQGRRCALTCRGQQQVIAFPYQ